MAQREIIHDYPAYTVYANKNTYAPNDNLYIGGRRFWIHDCMSMALASGRCPMEAMEREASLGYEQFWISPCTVTLSSHPRTKGFCFQVEPGSIITYAGRKFQVCKAPNQNYRLVEQKEV